MPRMRSALAMAVLLTLAFMAQAAPYSAQRTQDHGIEVIHLTDTAHHAEVSIVPSVGNMAYEYKVNGKNLLYFPFSNVAELRDKPTLCGVPFLAPWANRIAGVEYWANGKKYLLNGDLGSVHKDGNGNPIHGVLGYSSYWEVLEAKADGKGAHLTSRLQFWKHPELMAQWPFAHEYQMTYRLTDGVLEVATSIRNLSADPMPVSIGYHPYFELPDVPRDQWVAHLAAEKAVKADNHLIATGEYEPLQSREVHIADHPLDNGYFGLVRNGDGTAVFSVEGAGKKISVVYGPKYTVAVAYAPPRGKFICFEPMTAVTNGINLAHEGKFPELQSVAPGAEWHESFWVKPSGF